MVCKKHYDDGEACAACEKDKTIRDLRAEYNRFVDAVHDQMPPLERELAEARAECERLRDAGQRMYDILDCMDMVGDPEKKRWRDAVAEEEK